jgi:hypothetical protein
MELAWELKGYSINISVLKKRLALSKAARAEEQILEPARSHLRPEQAHEDLLRASGARFVGPIR